MTTGNGENDAIFDALDSLFELGEAEERERIESGDLRVADLPPARLAIDVPRVDGLWEGGLVVLPSESAAFAREVDVSFQEVEALLGLRPGQSKSRILPFALLSEDAIEDMLDADACHETIKPDQADPILARLPGLALAGESAHGAPAKPALARIKRLAQANQTLRRRADRVVKRKAIRFVLQPSKLFSDAARDPNPDALAAMEATLEEWIEACVELLAGAHGHWDRDGRWPCCLMLLQAMSLACAAAVGKRGAPRELADIAAQLELPCFQYLNRSAKSFRATLATLRIDLEAARHATTGEFRALRASVSA